MKTALRWHVLFVALVLALGGTTPALAETVSDGDAAQGDIAHDQVILDDDGDDLVVVGDADDDETLVDDEADHVDPADEDDSSDDSDTPADPTEPGERDDPAGTDDPAEGGDDPVTPEPADGWDVLDDGSRCYRLDGELVTGWLELDGNRYWFDPETCAMVSDRLLDIEGESYLFAATGELLTGWQTLDGGVFYFDPTTGAMLKDGAYDIEGLCAPVTSSDAELADVTEKTPHDEDIQWLYESGISTGWSESDGSRTFRPANTVIRQDMAAFLYRLAGSPEFVPTDEDVARFSDVTATTPHALEIWWLASTGVAKGWSDGTFRPTNTVVRQDMAAFLHRLAGDEEYVPTDEEYALFADVDPSTPHAEDILWLASTGVSTGWTDGDGIRTFRPTNSVLRQDMAAFLHRMVEGGVFEPTATHEYLFDESGALVTGWVDDEGTRRFYDRTNGALVTSGWVKDGSDWSYIDPATKELLKGGIHKVLGLSYLFDDDGIMQRGWASLADGKHFFNRSNGSMLTDGIHSIDGASYLFDKSGVMTTGWYAKDGSTYFFDRSTGKMVKNGIYEIDGDSYYFRANGTRGQGWLNKNGSTYFFDRSTGKMCKNGIFAIDGASYYFRANGTMGTGWVTLNGSRYYFDTSTGKMYKNVTFTKDGKYYKADSTGKVTEQPALYPDMFQKAQGYSSRTGYLILVDCSGNRCCVYRGSYGNWVPVYEWRCTTGAAATPTKKGVFSVTGKGYSFGDGFTCYYYTQFYGDFLIHSVLYYQNTFTVMDGRLGIDASHGCVRLALENAKWIYDNVPYGSTVVTY